MPGIDTSKLAMKKLSKKKFNSVRFRSEYYCTVYIQDGRCSQYCLYTKRFVHIKECFSEQQHFFFILNILNN